MDAASIRENIRYNEHAVVREDAAVGDRRGRPAGPLHDDLCLHLGCVALMQNAFDSGGHEEVDGECK
jgi:hypothetical protein